MIVIGSTALNYHLIGRTPQDIDLVGTYQEVEKYIKETKAYCFYPINSGKTMLVKSKNTFKEITEIEIAWPGSRAEKLIEFVKEQSDTIKEFHCIPRYSLFPSLDVLYMLKMSHRYLKDSPHFLKTMEDIHFLREAGAKIRPEHLKFYEERMKDTYTYAHPKLKTSKDGFFDSSMNGVFQKYDHDSIHEAVKHYDAPAYTFFQDGQVWCSKEKWDKCSEIVQLSAVLEESYVLALERSLIPFPNAKTPKEAFDMALMKVCTSITSGWFREYAWENYYKVQGLYNENYVQKFENGVVSGAVRLNGQ